MPPMDSSYYIIFSNTSADYFGPNGDLVARKEQAQRFATISNLLAALQKRVQKGGNRWCDQAVIIKVTTETKIVEVATEIR